MQRMLATKVFTLWVSALLIFRWLPAWTPTFSTTKALTGLVHALPPRAAALLLTKLCKNPLATGKRVHVRDDGALFAHGLPPLWIWLFCGSFSPSASLLARPTPRLLHQP